MPSAWWTRGDYAEAALVPNAAAELGYLTIELAGEPYRWRSLLSWAPQVDRWLAAVPRSRMSVDQLVIAVRELDVPDQIEQGLRWIERIVAGAGKNCASTYTLPEWLRERRRDLVALDLIDRWRRVVACSSSQAIHGSLTSPTRSCASAGGGHWFPWGIR
jgi:hypothetical protein